VQKTIQANGKIIDLSSPIVMGIINVNADSFFGDSRVETIDQAIIRTQHMLDAGAKIIDIGAMSSRPGADIIDIDTEKSILHPIVKAIRQHFPLAVLSIDTVHSAVVAAMAELGVDMINDISAGEIDPKMMSQVATSQLPYVMMHMQGTPKTMQINPTYEHITTDVIRYFVNKISKAHHVGIRDILIDPGFGFGKSVDHNFKLMGDLSSFGVLGLPLLIGISRKSFIYKTLSVDVDHSLNGTTAVHMAALINGAKILRVHDVAEAVQCIHLYKKIVENPD
jgi:dihydropteroate synthase